MDESSFGDCECSEPPSPGSEQDDPPGSSGQLSVLTLAERTSPPMQSSTKSQSVLDLLRNGAAPASPSRKRPANGHPVAATAAAESTSSHHSNGVRRDTSHHAKGSRRLENPLTVQFRERFFPDTSDEDWDDWRWQSRHRIKTLDQFERILDLSAEERDVLSDGGTMLPTAITPYYMSLLDAENPLQALRKTVVPTTREFVRTVGEADDPLGEDGHSPVPV